MENRALFDANIWFSKTLTDWVCLLHLEEAHPVFEILWTNDIFSEASYHLRSMNPDHAANTIHSRFDRLRRTAPAGEISGYQINDRSHPDEGDWHVINAAIHGNAGYLVTDDSSFHDLANADEYPFEIHTSDSFLMLVADSAPLTVERVVEKQQTYWRTRGGSFNLATRLIDAGAPQFAEIVRSCICRVHHQL